ncbi:DUF167 domain-containing protein [Kordiimonas pumila]|uniref:UPF0235 protein ACFOKA_06240 n=1 Tax=Kordiimonas pumila TaxID=2161677 RepID=A0ABV7D2U9_9PROT|nr:DUF167 domain-containing protein [Kordiimonas pumila]
MLKSHENGVILSIKLTPKASKNALVRIGLDQDNHKVLYASVTAVPEKGKANTALIKLLSKELGQPKSAFQLISGELSRRKTVLILGESDALTASLRASITALQLPEK